MAARAPQLCCSRATAFWLERAGQPTIMAASLRGGQTVAKTRLRPQPQGRRGRAPRTVRQCGVRAEFLPKAGKFFCALCAGEIEMGKGLSMAKVNRMKELGAEWKSLSAEAKAPYEAPSLEEFPKRRQAALMVGQPVRVHRQRRGTEPGAGVQFLR